MRLTVFTGPMCHACHQLKSHLDSKGVDYNEEDVTVNGGAKSFVQMRNGGKLTVPLLWDQDSCQQLEGFSPERVNRFLEGI